MADAESDSIQNTSGNARQCDAFVKTIFACIYPVVADQILERTGITSGACLDLGSGPAPLAIALAWLSDLRITALDCSPEMFDLARENIKFRHMEDRVVPLLGDVQAIPAADNTFDLVISRGSYHSWANFPVAFREICRVLRPGGMAYIGWGYGSARIREEVLTERRKCGIADDPEYPDRIRFRRFRDGQIADAVHAAGIGDHRIISDDSGFWILIRKPG
jgi:SAM-dependent methyltransferase